MQKTLGILFKTAVTGGGISLAAMVGLKAAEDYCAITPRADPFASENIKTRYAERERDFCQFVEASAPYNIFYRMDEKVL